MQFCVDYYPDMDTWHLEVQLTTPKLEEGGWSGPNPRARWGWMKFLGIYKTRDAAKAAAARLGTAILPDENLNWQEEGVGVEDSLWDYVREKDMLIRRRGTRNTPHFVVVLKPASRSSAGFVR